MKKETFQRVVEIKNRLDNLNRVLEEITPSTTYKLNYVDKDNKGSAEWIMKHVGGLLDMHDVMIRTEIQKEIDALLAEIETL